MIYVMFVHELADGNMMAGKAIGALKFEKGKVSVTGDADLVGDYKKILSSSSWRRAAKVNGNPFSVMFGNSSMPRYKFHQGKDADDMYAEFLKNNKNLKTESI